MTDTNGQALTYVSVQLPESSDGGVLVVRVPCVAGMSLTADDDPDVRVLARENGTADPFQDLASSPLDLTPYAGADQDFDVKLHANSVSGGIVTKAVGVRATYNP